MERGPSGGVFRERLAGVDADGRLDLRFFAGVAGSAVVPTKLEGDEVAPTGGDGRTETTRVVDPEIDVNKVEEATDVSAVEVVFDADPETRGPTRQDRADTRG